MSAKASPVAAIAKPASQTADSVLAAARSIPTKTGAIRLASLRAALPGMSRAQQDSHLNTLHREGKISLYREDNTPKLTQGDKDAAITVGGNPRHILYVK